MKVKAFLITAFLSASVSLFSQENETKGSLTYSNITEFGFFTTSPQGVAFEATTTQGFSIDKTHHLGLGIGIGFNNYKTTTIIHYNYSSSDKYTIFYMPVFVNYRFYFKPHKTFSPHLNIAVGGTMVEEGAGIYSAITMGFKAGKFSFSSGCSFMAFEGEEKTTYSAIYPYSKTVKKWIYPFGITLKWGFAF